MAPYAVVAPYREEDRTGVTIAVAVLLRIDGGRMPFAIDVEKWVQEIDAALIPVFSADETTPMGVAIRVSERDGKQIPANLILDAAVACPAHFERSQDETPARTVAHFDTPRGGITN